MNEITMATIIKNLSDELYATLEKLHETETMLKMARNDSTDWFMQYQATKKELDLLKATERLNAELPNMEDVSK